MSGAARRISRGISIFAVGAALALVFVSSASAATFDARGSVEQVYVTDLPAGAGISLLDSGDGVVEYQIRAGRAGGRSTRPVLFGDVFLGERGSKVESARFCSKSKSGYASFGPMNSGQPKFPASRAALISS